MVLLIRFFVACSLAILLAGCDTLERQYVVKPSVKLVTKNVLVQRAEHATLIKTPGADKKYSLTLFDVNPAVISIAEQTPNTVSDTLIERFVETWVTKQEKTGGIQESVALIARLAAKSGDKQDISIRLRLSNPRYDSSHKAISYIAELVGEAKQEILDHKLENAVLLFS